MLELLKMKIENDWFCKTFKSNKLMSFHIDDDKLLEKYRTVWIKTYKMLNVELNYFPGFDDNRYTKAKMGRYGNKVRSLGVPKDGVECKSFTMIYFALSTDYEHKYYSQVYFDKFSYRIIEKKMVNCLDDNLF